MDIVTKLKQVSHYCSEHDNQCRNCVYESKNYWCVPMELADYLRQRCPDEWDVNKIERILNDEDPA